LRTDHRVSVVRPDIFLDDHLERTFVGVIVHRR
jgi:hypothetical protein